MSRWTVNGVDCSCITPPPQASGPHEERCAINVNDRMLTAMACAMAAPAPTVPVLAPPEAGPTWQEHMDVADGI